MLTLADIKGVGSATIKKLNDLDIHNVFEVFSFLPRKYIDLQQPISSLHALNGQLCLLEGKVERVSDVAKFGKKMFYVMFRDTISTSRAYFKALFYNMPFLHDNFEVGQSYRLFGKVVDDFGVASMTNPKLEKIDKISKLEGVYTVYPLRDVLGQSAFKNIVYAALDGVRGATFKGNLAQVYQDMTACFEQIHRPKSVENALDNLDKLASIDLAVVLSIFKKIKKSDKKQREVFYKSAEIGIDSIKNAFFDAISFSPTPSQAQAIDEIVSDLQSNANMSRVLSGDVGSGKTAVAFFAMCYCALNNHQSVLMAPTEILARQHSQKFQKIAKAFGIKYAVLTSSTTPKDRESIVKGIKSGEISCLIGTNAVVSDDIVYNDLALAIIDEQHRFGVNERAKLENKGANDILSMTATPIPRSMALTFYDDIQISRIEKRADAKTNVITSVSSSIDNVLSSIIKEVKQGKQAFIVCPSIYDDEGNNLMSIEGFVRDYSHHFCNLKVSILHGKMSNDEKTSAMNDFALKKTEVLIATSVIEVGIDTTASEIAILNADRFGLATLHQLRGRVGRDGSLAHCILHSQNDSEKAIHRLETLCASNDGQYLAEIDFEMRGAGEFIGLRQSGRSSTPIFDLPMSASILKNAKEYSSKVLANASLSELLALTHQSQSRVRAFIEQLQSVTLNS